MELARPVLLVVVVDDEDPVREAPRERLRHVGAIAERQVQERQRRRRRGQVDDGIRERLAAGDVEALERARLEDRSHAAVGRRGPVDLEPLEPRALRRERPQGLVADVGATAQADDAQVPFLPERGRGEPVGRIDEDARVEGLAELLREAGEKRVRIVIGLEDDDDMHFEIDSAPRLWHAARAGWCMTINWLIAHGADVNCCDLRFGFAPLTIAAATNQHDEAVILLDAGARVDSSTRV